MTRRSDGYYIVQVSGKGTDDAATVNGQSLGGQARLLEDSDVIELAGVKMGFFTD